MEMTPTYLRAAVDALVAHGFESSTETVTYGPVGDAESRNGTMFRLVRGETEQIVLELVEHPGDEPRYFVAIERFHGLRATSFELDSWKIHKDRIEFKLVGDGDASLGFAFVLTLAAPEGPGMRLERTVGGGSGP